MKHRSDTENYFQYIDLLKEVQCMIAELSSQSRNNPSYKHIWQVYQKVLEHEKNQREVSTMLYDSLPQSLSELNAPVGQSQNLLNDRDGELILQKASNAYESLSEIAKQVRQLAVRGASDTSTDDDRTNIDTQVDAFKAEADRIIATTKYNDLAIIGSSDVKVQVGPFNTSNDQVALTFATITTTGIDAGAKDQAAFGTLITAMDTLQKAINVEETKAGALVNRIRAAKDKSKEDIYSVAKSLETSLRGLAAYYRQMAQFYFAICPKKDIPSSLC